jgi:hypothetical protein
MSVYLNNNLICGAIASGSKNIKRSLLLKEAIELGLRIRLSDLKSDPD